MAVTPISMRDFDQQIHPTKEVIFFHTPFCGTCKLGEQMLEIVESTLGDQAPQIYTGRVSEWQECVQIWQIESVPALVFLENGKVLNKVYAFRSVPDLLTIFNTFLTL